MLLRLLPVIGLIFLSQVCFTYVPGLGHAFRKLRQSPSPLHHSLNLSRLTRRQLKVVRLLSLAPTQSLLAIVDIHLHLARQWGRSLRHPTRFSNR